MTELTLQQENELLTSDIELKLSQLKKKDENSYIELKELFEEFKNEGATIQELRLLHDDVLEMLKEI